MWYVIIAGEFVRASDREDALRKAVCYRATVSNVSVCQHLNGEWRTWEL